MFDWATQKNYVGKAWSATCKLFLAKWSETLRKSRSYVNDEIKRIQFLIKKGGLLGKNRSWTYFKASSFACHSCFESVFGHGLAVKKARLKYRHRSLWTTWDSVDFFFLAGYENRHMDPDPACRPHFAWYPVSRGLRSRMEINIIITAAASSSHPRKYLRTRATC